MPQLVHSLELTFHRKNTKPLLFLRSNIQKLLLSTAFSILFVSFVSTSAALSQSTPLDEAKSNYTAQLTKFTAAKNDYITAKSSFQQFQTATAKADAFAKTKDYLLSADNLLSSYLSLVQEYGNQTRWQNTSFDKVASDQSVAQQATFIQNHLQKVQNAQTLEELPPLASELKSQLDKSTQPKINKIITTYDISQTESIFNNFKETSQFLNDFARKRITAENHTLLLNWQSEINDIREKTETNLSLAKQNYQKIADDGFNSAQIKQTEAILSLAKTELKRSRQLFEEMTKIL